jgi:hypothetical protein
MMARYVHLMKKKLFCAPYEIYKLPILTFQNRREFENELYERFGSLVKMPLLKSDRWEHFFVLFLSLAR